MCEFIACYDLSTSLLAHNQGLVLINERAGLKLEDETRGVLLCYFTATFLEAVRAPGRLDERHGSIKRSVSKQVGLGVYRNLVGCSSKMIYVDREMIVVLICYIRVLTVEETKW